MIQKADPMTIRTTNRWLIMRHLYHGYANTRSELSRQTGLTRTAISDVVSSLMEDGFICEVGYRSGLPGKPPMILEIPNCARYIIGVQIEVGYVRGILGDLRGNIIQQKKIILTSTESGLVISAIRELISALLCVESNKVLGIGISSPGIINTTKGIINYAANLGWRDVPLKQMLGDDFGVPLHVANDTTCAGLAETLFGLGKGFQRVCTIVVEAGVGAGIIISDEQCVEMTNGSAEIGHLKIFMEKRWDGLSEREYALEELIGKKGLNTHLENIAKSTQDQDLLGLLDSDFNVKTIADMAQKGNQGAKQFINETGYILGKGIAVLINLMHPNVVILSGSICGLGETLLSSIWDVIRVDAIDEYIKELEIITSCLDYNVVLGAAALPLRYELGLI